MGETWAKREVTDWMCAMLESDLPLCLDGTLEDIHYSLYCERAR